MNDFVLSEKSSVDAMCGNQKSSKSEKDGLRFVDLAKLTFSGCAIRCGRGDGRAGRFVLEEIIEEVSECAVLGRLCGGGQSARPLHSAAAVHRRLLTMQRLN